MSYSSRSVELFGAQRVCCRSPLRQQDVRRSRTSSDCKLLGVAVQCITDVECHGRQDVELVDRKLPNETNTTRYALLGMSIACLLFTCRTKQKRTPVP